MSTLDKIKEKAEVTNKKENLIDGDAPEGETFNAPDPETKVEQDFSKQEKFQHYSSLKSYMRLTTESGRLILFINKKFVTQDKELIKYLNAQIEICNYNEFGVKKGEYTTEEDANPMAVIQRKMEEELREKITAEVLAKFRGETRDMGSSDNPGQGAIGKMLSTSGISEMSAGSSAEKS